MVQQLYRKGPTTLPYPTQLHLPHPTLSYTDPPNHFPQPLLSNPTLPYLQ